MTLSVLDPWGLYTPARAESYSSVCNACEQRNDSGRGDLCLSCRSSRLHFAWRGWHYRAWYDFLAYKWDEHNRDGRRRLRMLRGDSSGPLEHSEDRSMRTLSGGSDRKWDVEKDLFTAVFLGRVEEKIPGKRDKAGFLNFLLPDGTTMQKNSTTLWDRWVLGDKSRGTGPALKKGEVVKIRKIEETGKKGSRWYSFTLDVLEGKEIPAALKSRVTRA